MELNLNSPAYFSQRYGIDDELLKTQQLEVPRLLKLTKRQS